MVWPAKQGRQCHVSNCAPDFAKDVFRRLRPSRGEQVEIARYESLALLLVHSIQRQDEQVSETVSITIEGAGVDVGNRQPFPLKFFGNRHGACSRSLWRRHRAVSRVGRHSYGRITALLQRRQANDREAGRASGDAKPVPEDRSYNSFRPHSSLGNQTSVEPERSRLFVIAGPQVGQAQHRRTLT